jgi:hypothetical protein
LQIICTVFNRPFPSFDCPKIIPGCGSSAATLTAFANDLLALACLARLNAHAAAWAVFAEKSDEMCMVHTSN